MREIFGALGKARSRLDQKCACTRPGQGQDRPAGRDRRNEHIILDELALEPFLKPGRDTIRARARRTDEEMILAQPHANTIVDNDAKLVEHQPISDLADF